MFWTKCINSVQQQDHDKMKSKLSLSCNCSCKLPLFLIQCVLHSGFVDGTVNSSSDCRKANQTTNIRVTFLIFLSEQLYRFVGHEWGDPAPRNWQWRSDDNSLCSSWGPTFYAPIFAETESVKISWLPLGTFGSSEWPSSRLSLRIWLCRVLTSATDINSIKWIRARSIKALCLSTICIVPERK